MSAVGLEQSAGFEWKKDRGGKERRVPFRVHLRNTWACVERKEWEEVQSPRLVLKGEPARSDGLTSSDFLLTSF